ncbi:MAG: translation initiation factor [Deltaproteobacteria bacterium]|nr:translation initiation factor [Deltaproteobacteria bacterium]MBW2254892.1 translation initiation factor [Deltaproteobacteria bacterium]
MSERLADLLQRAGFKASVSSDDPAEDRPSDAPDVEEVRYASKVAVRFSRKGRRGKTVTLVSGVTSGREAVLAKLRRELGVGARIEGEQLVVQGHQVERVARWLESQGVKRVVR